jgi:carbamoyl-phosphate synthase large subunit
VCQQQQQIQAQQAVIERLESQVAQQGERIKQLEEELRAQKKLKGKPKLKASQLNNTPAGSTALEDDRSIRRTALAYKVPIITTIAGAKATAAAIQSLQQHPLQVKSLQEYIGMGA